MTVTDFYDSKSLVWLGSSTTIHDYRSDDPANTWVTSTITRTLEDINYAGRPPGLGTDSSNPPGYSIWTDPMLWVAVGVVGAVVLSIGMVVYFTRKRARLWELAEIEKFEAKTSEPPESP